MKYTSLVLQREGSVSPEEAEGIVGGPQLLKLLRDADWLKPAIQAHRLTRYDYEECVVAWKRLKMEGYDALKQAAGGGTSAS